MDGWGADKDESRSVYDGFREAGGNFIDSANVYSGGRSESFLGEFIAKDRDTVVLATKYSIPTRGHDVNGSGNSRKNMMESVHASLKRLDTDYIDLYWVHFKDHTTPVEEIIRGLDDLVSQGKVLYVGISDAPAWQVARANTIANFRGWSTIRRAAGPVLVARARRRARAAPEWRGLSTSRSRPGMPSDRACSRASTTPNPPTSRRTEVAGRRCGATSPSARSPLRGGRRGGQGDRVHTGAVGARLGARGRRQVLPLVGARTRSQLDDNLGCLGVSVSDEHRARLDAVSATRVPFPQNMINPMASSSIVTHRSI